MLDMQLANAGFYRIAWPETNEKPGTTYVRTGSREVVRVFVTQCASEVEVYAGGLRNGQLVFRGSPESAASLRYLVHQQN
ncbi:hypothetical protein FY528_01605 [Hymenobacter lutimineralis]|uniref:Uncharacterized protein n=1 Tax=Hymenobacter lutimineralis TaxID=2606448 RepID=A0A5D6VEG5_9BACT|nr:hypothetical protein [Hymenobacter lutimineralis]TYZ14451.1 hypothetical protein FY528_01605 [Hymenobacter lutimineralis]